MKNLHAPKFRPTPLLLAAMSVALGCGHPASGTNGAGGNSQQGAGGDNVQGQGGNIGGGTGGAIVLPPPDGGAGGMTTSKISCNDSSFPGALSYSPGYPGHAANLAMAQSMLQSLTPDDKLHQMAGIPSTPVNYDVFWQPDNTAKSIKGFTFRDGPRGVNMDAPLLAGSRNGKSTAFPQAIARGAAFDIDLEYHIGQAMGDEMVAAGQTMLLAPTVNILRHPSWGRAQETYGEDPFQLGRLGSAFTVGVQEYVGACVKHFAANNIEQGRDSANAIMNEQTLREIYARHFGMIIKDGGVSCVMASYNKVNGTNSTQNRHLLTDILRTDFGFQGFVLSDWWAMPGGSNAATLSADSRRTNATQAVNAGLDMELPWSFQYAELGSVTGLDTGINTATSRILEQKIRFKAMSLAGPVGLKPATSQLVNGSIANNDSHIALAEEAARKSMVLLKNDGALPLDKATIHTIAVIGARIPYAVSSDGTGDSTIDFTTNLVTGGATTILTGDWGSSRVVGDPAKAVGPLPGIREAAGTAITVTGGPDPALAAGADATIVVAGLTPQDEGEEYTNTANPDRQSFALDAKRGAGTQNTLIMNAVSRAAGKPVIVVLEGSGPIDMPWLSSVKGVIMAWYPGMVGGRALGKLLFGDANFSGKLPITWGAVADYGTFKNGTDTQMDFYLGYRRFDQNNIPLDPAAGKYPFGYGLKYGADIQYTALRVPCTDIGQTGAVDVQIDVYNRGTREVDETVFLFVTPPASAPAGVLRAKKELKGFARITLPPGMGRGVTIKVRMSDLAYFDPAATGGGWKVQPGVYTIRAGGSSADLPVMDTLTVR
ncbi:MAG TPA: glycoside hydrolase family 3 N-terminal domain-containing protein [Polyangia bacterium]|jgi:beta-glucosidase|nr:glycoside hydrolase family 3 N-terminal domain-containing protein [Polyangia bacterium]